MSPRIFLFWCRAAITTARLRQCVQLQRNLDLAYVMAAVPWMFTNHNEP